MIEKTFFSLLVLAGVYSVAGVATAVWFFARRIKRLDPPAAGGSLGFRVLIVPGVVALWPVILMKTIRPGAAAGPDRAEELRRSHLAAILVLTAAGLLVFAAALAWRAPGFDSLPETETPVP